MMLIDTSATEVIESEDPTPDVVCQAINDSRETLAPKFPKVGTTIYNKKSSRYEFNSTQYSTINVSTMTI